MPMTCDGEPVLHNTPITIRAGQTLTIGQIGGAGQRAYLAVVGGFDAPVVFGSRATFGLGQFGGNATGTLRAAQSSASPARLRPI